MGRATSVGAPSVYSHSQTITSGTRSRSQATGLRSARSTKSLKVPWYKRPLVNTCFGFDIQRLAFYTGFYSFFLSLFTIATCCFNIYCLIEASPGSVHYGYYLISFDFVYIGNVHVRNSLITIAVFSTIGAIVLFLTTLQLLIALRNEYETKMIPWLCTMMVFATWNVFGFIFIAVVNDMIFTYNIVMCLLWILFSILNFCGWAAVYSLYLELCDLTKLEDIAHLRIGTMASLNTQSMAGSRPITPISPHSTITTPNMQLALNVE